MKYNFDSVFAVKKMLDRLTGKKGSTSFNKRIIKNDFKYFK
jgi:hypothetical protein